MRPIHVVVPINFIIPIVYDGARLGQPMTCRQRNVSVAAHALWRNEVDFDEAPTLFSSHSLFPST